MEPEPRQFVSRAGHKLDAALDHFGLGVAGLTCADLGCSTGGFTDCLLQRGAQKVFAVDTAYGQLAWKLRNDPRVVVMERANALHGDPPERCDLCVIDLGWTRQARVIPAAARWVKPAGVILTLVKPHYESGEHRLDDARAEAIARTVIDQLPGLAGWMKSPLAGGKGGNAEWFALLRVEGRSGSGGAE